MKSGVTIVKDKVAAVLRGLKALSQHDVLVGIPRGKSSRSDEGGMNNAAIGYIMENGAPEVNIPARPWLVPGVADARPRVVALMKQAGQAALKGDTARIDRIMHATGLVAVSAVQRRITTGPFQPLSPRTLAARRARGRTGTKPLIDTGQLRRAVSYVVRNGKR